MKKRCNQLMDCPDESDEENCKLLILPRSYNSKVAPAKTVSAYDKTIIPAAVNISMVLFNVINIEESKHVIELQFKIVLEWFENRATFYNLKENTLLNALSKTDISRLWIPNVVYDNTDMKERVELKDDIDTR